MSSHGVEFDLCKLLAEDMMSSIVGPFPWYLFLWTFWLDSEPIDTKRYLKETCKPKCVSFTRISGKLEPTITRHVLRESKKMRLGISIVPGNILITGCVSTTVLCQKFLTS
ncbi:hypothetical protein OPV22_032638 [Ensete ventricosum]|uniref:Uncharacterized protein n=1 Tax=Ensete ventricosum TaxID=4639 RepID=A0AAV8PVZ4_ENSVE|nr:hypothetical protein OPV22_032638 [Ensete ventricosum]